MSLLNTLHAFLDYRHGRCDHARFLHYTFLNFKIAVLIYNNFL